MTSLASGERSLHAESASAAGQGPHDPHAGPPPTAGRTRPPLVLAHGFTQTGRLWGPFGAALEEGRPVIRVDLPGHGGSSAVTATGVPDAAQLLMEAAAARAGSSPVDLCGYSLGARIALHAALAHPEQIGRLVLIGATGGLEDDARRATRHAADEELARALEDSGDVAAFIERWLASPMFRRLDPEQAGVAERLRNTAAGLASSLRTTGTGSQAPVWLLVRSLPMPVLLVAGADDARFVRAALRLADAIPAATVSLVPGAGHAAHLEQPAVTARIVTRWLDSVAGALAELEPSG